MFSKNNITRCAKSIKQLIRRCESYGDFDKNDYLLLSVEKTSRSSIKLSKAELEEYEASGININELHKMLENKASECSWSESDLDIQVPSPKLRTKIF
jgi:hypothetical protein